MMELPNPKELKALLKVCREFGVEDVSVGELKIKFGELPQAKNAQPEEQVTPGPTEEQLLYWSSQPDPLATREDLNQ